MRPPLILGYALTLADEQGHPLERTKPRRTRASEEANINAEFFCGGVRWYMVLAGGLGASESVRAPSERELICIPCFREAVGPLRAAAAT